LNLFYMLRVQAQVKLFRVFLNMVLTMIRFVSQILGIFN